MFLIIIKQLFRSFRKDKVHFIFNLLGLSFGLTAGILVLLYVQQVQSFDKFHKNKDRIYRYGISMTIGSSPSSIQGECSPGAGPILKQAIPGIEDFVRTLYLRDKRVIINESVFKETGNSLMWADNSILTVFTFPLLSGDQATALERPNTIVLTQDLALKYFGTIDVLGKVVKIESTGDFEITGVLKKVPSNNGIPFSALLSMVTINSLSPGDYKIADLGGEIDEYLYLLFSKGFTAEDFNSAFRKWYRENMASVDNVNYLAVVEPYTNYYLHSVIWSEFSQKNRMILTGFISIGLLLLILACVNYINLATSRSEERAKEIGIKKISGIGQKSLRLQLIGESVIMTYISMTIALVITEFLLNFTKARELIASVNELAGVGITLNPFDNPLLLGGILLIPIVVGVAAGFYPAFLISGMSPLAAIKASHGGDTGRSFVRRFLIIFQFTISIGALILGLLMSRQIRKISECDPGFDKNNLIYIYCRNQSVKNSFKIYREVISHNPEVISSSFSDRSPGMSHEGATLLWQRESGELEIYAAVYVQTDNDYFRTIGINVKSGTVFLRPRLEKDTVVNFLVSETFVKDIGWKEAIGKRNHMGKTIGVFKDFHYGPLIYKTRPMFILPFREDKVPDILNVRLSRGNHKKTIAFLKKTWEETIPGALFDFEYAEELINRQYLPVKNQGVIIKCLAGTCLLISCFGMFSYSSYVAHRRRKDFVLRKVYGATGRKIFSEFSVMIIRIILVSSVFAILLSWLSFDEWSKNFSYNPPFNKWIFAGAIAWMLLLVIITTAYHIVMTARTNPAETLKVE